MFAKVIYTQVATIFRLKRIARSAATVLVLTLFQTIAAPVLSPSIFSNSSQAATFDSTGMILNWDMSNASSYSGQGATVINDLSGNSSNGTVTQVGTATFPTYTNTAPKYLNISAGTNNYYYARSGDLKSKLDQSDANNMQNISFFAWVYPTGNGIVVDETDAANGWQDSQIEMADGVFSFRVWGSAELTSSTSTPLNYWYYVGLVYDFSSKTLTAYINGVQVGQLTSLDRSAPWETNSSYGVYYSIGRYDPTNLGSGSGGNFRFGAFHVFKTPLTAAMVKNNYEAGLSRFGPTIGNPSSSSNYVNRNSKFSITACSGVKSASACLYQWEESTDGGLSWASLAETSTSYTTPLLTTFFNGRKFRITAKDPGVNSDVPTTIRNYAISAEATLTVTQPPGSDTDTALTLDGSTQYAKVDDSAEVDFSASFTFEAWIRPTVVTGLRMILNKENSVEFYINDGVFGFSGQDGINQWAYLDNGVKAVVNEWHHIAYTKDSTSDKYRFYLDGQFVVESDADALEANKPYDSSLPLTIGGRSGTGSPLNFTGTFKGQIDHVAVYQDVRTPTEIQSDMSSHAIAGNPDLQLYYDFNEGTGTTLYNRKLNATAASDLTIVGTPNWDHVAEISSSVLTNYTVARFPRTYLTPTGGWKVPASMPTVSILTVGAGGGGGAARGSGGAGGGGGGQVVFNGTYSLTSNSFLTIRIGVGGIGATSASSAGGIGESTTVGGLITALGGGGGATIYGNTSQVNASSYWTGGGGSAQATRLGTPGNPSVGRNGGAGNANNSSGADQSGGGGGGSGGDGEAGTVSKGGDGGAGIAYSFETTTSMTYGGGGGGGKRTSESAGTGNGGGGNGGLGSTDTSYTPPTNGRTNSGGGGGGAGTSGDGAANLVSGGNGAAGVVVIRWITASIPSYTKPTNAYLNVGMTETFTTNIAVDSATVGLTRTFKWESTTPLANGAYTLIKQGTGGANAFFSWIPSDTSTSGSGYLYRLTVTDSDTAGLFITDSSTAYAVINRALSVSGTTGLAKTINVAKNETFTITLGTSTYRTTMTTNNPGISLDTSTATSPVVKISETMTVGTYYETLTVTDSVSASVITPLTIVVSAPPSLLNTNEIVDSNLIFHLDAGNSRSLLLADGSSTSGVNWKDLSGNGKDAVTGGTFESGIYARSCAAPTYFDDFGGYVKFDGSTTCYGAPYSGFQMNKSISVEAWVRLDGATLKTGSAIVAQNFGSSGNINFILGDPNSAGNVYFGLHDGQYRLSSGYVTLAQGSWTHIVGTYDGQNFAIYKNGIQQGSNAGFNGGLSANLNTAGTLIGRRWSDTGNPYFNGSIATVRIYKIPLTATQILQNYNASKSRFTSDNVNFSKPSLKYGNRLSESFTATSGYGNDTISYATGSKPGLTWSTSGAVTTLNVTESLTATTHYDTITVTDSLGASTYLPIKMTVSKADTLTISMDTPTTVVYNASPITVYPKVYFKGLVGVDTLTASTRFTSSTYTDSATVPTDVDTYTVIAANPVFSVGALSNYLNVVYETSTAKVTQANQNKLSINLYGAVAGSSFLIQTFGGSGDGPVTESVTAGSTATGCAVSNHVLSNTSPSTQQVTCNILVTKAASKNYKVETLTATVYFMLYVNNMPTNQVGNGSTIALNGINSVWVDPGATPTITGPGAGTYAANGPITITGSGFSLGPIIVKFERNQLGTNITVASDTAMNVTIPADARSGVFSVTNKNGTEFSSFTITIG